MKIKKVPLEYGWDWFTFSWKVTKDDKFKFIHIGLTFILLSQAVRLIPYAGTLISGLILSNLFVGLFRVAKNYKENKEVKYSLFIRSLFSLSTFKKYLPITYFKFFTSVLALGTFILLEYKTKFIFFALGGITLEYVTTAIVFNAIGLVHEFNMEPKEALKFGAKSILRNFIPEALFMVWATIIILASALPFLMGFPLTCSTLVYSPFLKFSTIFEKEESMNNVESFPHESEPAAEHTQVSFQKASGE
jgi:hypothetical protein